MSLCYTGLEEFYPSFSTMYKLLNETKLQVENSFIINIKNSINKKFIS